MKRLHTLVASLLAVVLTACGGGGDDRLPVNQLGVLQGPLADDAQRVFVASASAEPGRPWIIGEGQFSATDLAPVAAAWRAGQPVVLFNAVQAEADALTAALGIPSPRLLLQPTDVVAMRPKANGYCLFTTMVYPPDDVQVIGPDGEISLDPVWESPAQREAARMNEVVQWLASPC